MVKDDNSISRGQLYKKILGVLEESGIGRFDALCIFESAFGEVFPKIMMDRTLEVPYDTLEKILTMVNKRSQGYPLQYILGTWEFMGFEFMVGEGVLISRQDTETLVVQVRDICLDNDIRSPKIIDLCSGSGCIAVSLKLMMPDAHVSAVEFSEKALEFLKKNSSLNGGADIHIVQGDVLDENTAVMFSDADIIVCNPPYLTEDDMRHLQREVSFEPESALFGGSDGLDFYRKITKIWRNSLKDRGFIAYEFGMGQHEAVSRILEENRFTDIKFRRDAGGIIRTAAARKNTEVLING